MKLVTIYINIIALLLLGSLSLKAQKKPYKGVLGINVQELQQEDDSLYVDIIFDARDLSVYSKNSLDLIPVLVSATQSLELPKMVIKGRNNFKAYNRSLSLMSKGERNLYQMDPTYTLLKSYKDNDQKLIRYKMAIAYEPWMANARLDLREEDCGCNGSRAVSSVNLIAQNITLEKIIAPYEIVPYLAYVQPVAEPIKQRSVESEAYLDFAVAKTVIHPEFGNNPRELEKINRMIDDVRGDDAVTVRGIEISGFASPEGSTALNNRLSEGRAKALQTYITPRYSIPKDMYSVVFGGEDWDGLRKLVNASNMEYKQSVLFAIDNGKTPEQKKAAIAAIEGGTVYRYMLEELYPSLRRVLMQVNYDVKQFDVSEAAEQIKTRPQNLSLNEMFLVANTFESGSPEFVNVFETAARLFPCDDVANLNAAASALVLKKLDVAENHLNKVSQKCLPEYRNNMGVLLLLKGDYTNAKPLLESALRDGVISAKSNLEELQKKQENIFLINKKRNR